MAGRYADRWRVIGVVKLIAGIVGAGVTAVFGLVVVLGGGEAAQAQSEPVTGCSLSTTPAAATSRSGASSDSPAGRSLGLSGEQITDATTIVATVKGLGIPLRGAEVAVATAYTEDGLLNDSTATDHDSVGLFQQRPSQGWGTVAQLTNPVYATTKFAQRMVLVPNWQSADPGVVAQAVQRSAAPGRYDQVGWPVGKPLADALWAGTDALTCQRASTAGAPSGVSGKAAAVLARAKLMLNKPYCWDGGTAAGPSHGDGGDGCGAGAVGFDCSGLMLYAWAPFVSLPHSAAQDSTLGVQVPIAQDRPGDLVFWDDGGDVHHVAMVWSVDGDGHGGGQVIEAQDFNVPVHIRTFRGDAESQVMSYAVRLS